jgi:assimilatory nitrate reductase catalytic subunit
VNAAVRTTCPYCGVGCGVVVTRGLVAVPGPVAGAAPAAALAIAAAASGVPAAALAVPAGPVATAAPDPVVTGDKDHPANAGRLCSKGAALGATLGLDGRLLAPRVHGRETGWNEALDQVAAGFSDIIERHGPDAVAFYVSGQLLTEDYYVANKLMKGYIGSANIDTNSRLCMSSAVAAHQRAFGEDLVPVSYEDLELADLIVLVGSNTAWCHPVLFQRIVAAKQRRPEMRIVVIDPRATATCESADLHLPIKAGTDVWLFNGLLNFLHRHGIEDRAFIDAHTAGAGRALAVAENTAGGTAAVARLCGLEVSALEQFYRLFARNERVVTLFSQGVNQSSSGTDKANSIINCHLLTGRIGRAGAGPFSITGQPNAMGGREVGGLANLLAAHMDLGDPAHRRIVQQFWRSPRMADRRGLKAVELFDAMHAGRVKAVWIAGTNPVVSMPNADKVRRALGRCELVVVSDCMANTDTALLAHVLLPATTWGEKDGTVTNSERCISRQRAFLDPPGGARADWWMFAEVAKRMGFRDGFDYGSARDVFVEHAALSAEENHGARAFDIGALSALTADAYAALSPVRWPLPARPQAAASSSAPHTIPDDTDAVLDRIGAVTGGVSPPATSQRPGADPLRLFADGRFYHADGRARFIATPPRAPAHALGAEYPLVLNTGRVRDQWHTMTRTGKAARLMAHSPEPFVDMHPQDALLAGVRTGEFVQVITHWGSLVARLRASGQMPRRMIFVPMHWSDECSANARVGALVSPTVDSLSGQPEFKHTPARVASFVVAWQGFAVSRGPLPLRDACWWSSMRGDGFMRYEMAGRRVFGDWSPWARRLLHAPPDADWLEYVDRATGIYRAAYLVDERIEGCVFLSPRPDLPPRGWVSGLFAQASLADSDRAGLLLGQPADRAADVGAVVCSCFGVGRNTICAAIHSLGLTSPAQIGQRLRAGTNCGSCIPELKAILDGQSGALDAAPEPLSS